MFILYFFYALYCCSFRQSFFSGPYIMSVVIVDQWLNNPMETREYALTLPYTTRGNYPGKRTRSYANSDWIPYLEKHLPGEERITWFDTHPFSYNGSFQICTEEDGSSWIHRDMTDWAGILFLGPPNETPIHSGLTLYRHKPSGYLHGDNTSKSKVPTDEDYRDSSQWEPSVIVGNVFNRMVLFRGSQFHKSSMYFGNSMANGRLFQVFFFNTSSPPLLRWASRALTMTSSVYTVHMIIFSTNRFEYLEKMLASMRRNVSFDTCKVYITLYDDYPAKRDEKRMHRLCETHGIHRLVQHPENVGLGKTWREAWMDIIEHPERGQWIFHVEEDIEFLKPVSVASLVETYITSQKPITQVFLKRNVCYSEDDDFIARMEAVSDSGDASSLPLQSDYFVAMCSVYPRDLVVRYDFSVGDPHEHTIRDFFKTWNMHSALYGRRQDTTIIHHLGEWSRGRKVSEDDSQAQRFARVHAIRGDYHYRTGLSKEVEQASSSTT
jgi:hypothetical protein